MIKTLAAQIKEFKEGFHPDTGLHDSGSDHGDGDPSDDGIYY